MPPDARLRDAAQEILDNLATELTAQGIDVPSHRYIHSGLIAHDFVGANCADIFVVSWVTSSQGELGADGFGALNPIRCLMPLNHTFNIALLRCVPVVKTSGVPPTAAELNTAGITLLLDAMTLPVAIVDLQGSRALFTSEHAEAAIAQVSAVGPQGGVGGVVVSLAVSLTI